jgi:hypothetical protein
MGNMEKYEKYLLTEAITASKSLEKLKKTLSDISTPLELHLAKSLVVDFIKKFKSYYNDDVSDMIDGLLRSAEKRVKR